MVFMYAIEQDYDELDFLGSRIPEFGRAFDTRCARGGLSTEQNIGWRLRDDDACRLKSQAAAETYISWLK